jgi:hypothetical protein
LAAFVLSATDLPLQKEQTKLLIETLQSPNPFSPVECASEWLDPEEGVLEHEVLAELLLHCFTIKHTRGRNGANLTQLGRISRSQRAVTHILAGSASSPSIRPATGAGRSAGLAHQ